MAFCNEKLLIFILKILSVINDSHSWCVQKHVSCNVCHLMAYQPSWVI